MRSMRNRVPSFSFNKKLLPAFPPFEKGGQGGFAVDFIHPKKKQISLDPPFTKGEETS